MTKIDEILAEFEFIGMSCGRLDDWLATSYIPAELTDKVINRLIKSGKWKRDNVKESFIFIEHKT